jgi:hypothetical protein
MMLVNPSTLTLNCSTAAQLETYVEYVDYVPGTSFTPARNTLTITAAGTVTLVTTPVVGTDRKIKNITIRNSGTTANTVQILNNSTLVTAAVALQPTECFQMDANDTWTVMTASGSIKVATPDIAPVNGTSICFRKSGTAKEAAGIAYVYAKDAGFPGVWSPGVPGVNGRSTNGTTAADAGCMPMPLSVGTQYLTQIQGAGTVAGDLSFIDIVWVNTALSTTVVGAQAIVSPAFPARDINATANGTGYCLGLLFTATGANAAAVATTTVTYTNSAGTPGRTATLNAVASIPITPVIGTMIPFLLAAGDTGVQSIQSFNVGTSLVTATCASLIVYIQFPGTPGTIANLNYINEIPTPGVHCATGVVLLPMTQCASTTAATTISGYIIITTR